MRPWYWELPIPTGAGPMALPRHTQHTQGHAAQEQHSCVPSANQTAKLAEALQTPRERKLALTVEFYKTQKKKKRRTSMIHGIHCKKQAQVKCLFIDFVLELYFRKGQKFLEW